MKVKNKAVIKKLSHRVLVAKKKKNIISVLAIVLTTVLFTAVFTIGGSMIKSTRESTMIQVGSSAHAGMERLTKEQFDIVSKDPKIHGVSYNIYAGNAVNPEFKNFPVEVRYREELDAKYTFSEPETGRMPKAKDEIAASSLVLKDLGVPCRLGETFTLEIAVNQEIIQHTFTLVGYWEGNQGMMAQCVNISRELCEEIAPTPLEPYYKNVENYSGYIDMELNFSTAWNIQKQADALMQRCGFDSNQVKCGVNWAYETDSIETADAIILAGLLLLIMLSGYLIIYNVFYLNVFNDIRFYGLLKTIGTTGRQLRRIVRKQAWRLCLFGIPVGLALGWCAGRILAPLMMSVLDQQVDAYSANPLIFAGATLFTIFTVHISCIKPCRIVSKISPVEAVKYTGQKVHKKKRKTRGFHTWSMAAANLGRSRKKLVLVAGSLSLSLIILNSVYTTVQGFDMDKFLESVMISDYMVTDRSVIQYLGYREQQGVTKEFEEALKQQEGIENLSEIYESGGAHVFSDAEWKKVEQIIETPKFQESLEHPEDVERMKEEKADYFTLYGIDEHLVDQIVVYAGTLDWETFNSGNYILVNTYNTVTNEDQMPLYQPGDKVTLTFSNGSAKEYKILAMAEIPTAAGDQSYGYPFDIECILPAGELKAQEGERQPTRVIFDAKKEYEDAVTSWLKEFCGGTENSLAYRTKRDYLQEFGKMKQMYSIAGGALSFILALIGVLNFVNVITTSILSRKQEFAMMESIGMTVGQQKRILRTEGLFYAVITILISVSFGSGISYGVVKAVTAQMWMFEYHFTLTPILISIPFLFLITWLVPEICYRRMRTVTVVERLREVEN